MTHTITALRSAVPYLKLYRNDTFVVKFGGEALQSRSDIRKLLEQLAVLQSLGIRIVVVHGGGPQANAIAERLGAASQFVKGRRITDSGMLEALILALNGEVRTTLLSVARELSLPAIGLSGVDAAVGRARKRPSGAVDFGFVGDIDSIDAQPVRHLLDGGYVPVLSPVCADDSGQLLNVNADVFASALAAELGAAKLLLVTKPQGIYSEVGRPETLLSHLDLKQLKALAAGEAFSEGMLPKSDAIEAALAGGVKRVHVISFQYPDSILTEVFTNEGCGTLIVRDERDLWPEENAVDRH